MTYKNTSKQDPVQGVISSNETLDLTYLVKYLNYLMLVFFHLKKCK